MAAVRGEMSPNFGSSHRGFLAAFFWAACCLFAVFWHSVALAHSGITFEAMADLEHAMLHWQDEGHHHHDDGSLHVGDSEESARVEQLVTFPIETALNGMPGVTRVRSTSGVGRRWA